MRALCAIPRTDSCTTITGVCVGMGVFERVFVVQLPNQRVFTVNSLVSDLFGWLVVAGFVVIVVLAIIAKRKGASARASD